jgi:hypothetical protein
VLKKIDLSIVENGDCTEQVGQDIQADQICAAGRNASNACFVSIKVMTAAGFYTFTL